MWADTSICQQALHHLRGTDYTSAAFCPPKDRAQEQKGTGLDVPCPAAALQASPRGEGALPSLQGEGTQGKGHQQSSDVSKTGILLPSSVYSPWNYLVPEADPRDELPQRCCCS